MIPAPVVPSTIYALDCPKNEISPVLAAPVADSQVTPRRGESLFGAIIREHQGNSGLSEMDRLALAAQDRERAAQTISELRDKLAQANELIVELQEQLAAVPGVGR